MADLTLLEAAAMGALAWALTYLVHSTVLIAGVATGLRALGRRSESHLRSLGWKVALVGGIATATLQLAVGFEPLGGRYVLPDLFAPAAEPIASATEPAPTIEITQAELELLALAAQAAPQPVLEPIVPAPADHPWRRAVALAWLSGAAYGVVRFAARAGRFRSRVADRLPVWDERALAALDDLRRRAGLRRAVRLRRSRSLPVPVTWGLLRPTICIPDRALEDLNSDELRAVLAHELGHVARLDALWLGLGQWIGAVLFFQPLNRIVRRGLARESEHLADAYAVSLTHSPLSLARCLAKVAGWLERVGPPTADQVAVATMAGSRGVLLERVEVLLDQRVGPRPRRYAAALVAGLPLALLPLAPAIAADSADRSGEAGDFAPVIEVREAAAPVSTEVGVEVGPEHLWPSIVAELQASNAELDLLREHPRATRFSAEIESLDRRVERLLESALKVREFLETDTPSTPSRNASRGVAPSEVPDRP